MEKDILEKAPGGGRNTNYNLVLCRHSEDTRNLLNHKN